jgi:hypothetical protein
MIRIVRVSRKQFNELIDKIPPQRRWVIDGLPVMNIFIPQEDVLIVRSDEVEVREFSKEEILSCVSAIHCAYDMKEVRYEADKTIPSV